MSPFQHVDELHPLMELILFPLLQVSSSCACAVIGRVCFPLVKVTSVSRHYPLKCSFWLTSGKYSWRTCIFPPVHSLPHYAVCSSCLTPSPVGSMISAEHTSYGWGHHHFQLSLRKEQQAVSAAWDLDGKTLFQELHLSQDFCARGSQAGCFWGACVVVYWHRHCADSFSPVQSQKEIVSSFFPPMVWTASLTAAFLVLYHLWHSWSVAHPRRWLERRLAQPRFPPTHSRLPAWEATSDIVFWQGEGKKSTMFGCFTFVHEGGALKEEVQKTFSADTSPAEVLERIWSIPFSP